MLWECYVDEAANKFHKTTPHYLAFRERAPEFMAKERVSDLYTGIYPGLGAGLMTEPVPAFGIGRLPRITFGAGSLAQVPGIVAGHGGRVLLITGGHSFNASAGGLNWRPVWPMPE